MSYKVCWSMRQWQSSESGCADSALNAFDDRRCEENDRVYGRLIQSERDPYLLESVKLGFGVKKPRRCA